MEQEFGVTKRYAMSVHEYNIHVEPSTDSTCGANNEDEKQIGFFCCTHNVNRYV